MLKKAIFHAWSLRREFTKYAMVGISGVVLDMGTLILLREYFHILPTIAVILNQPLALAYNFTLNKYWSFKSRAIPHRQMVRYAILTGWNYFFSWVSMFILHVQWGIDYRLARILGIALTVTWNFLLYKYWVYKEHEACV